MNYYNEIDPTCCTWLRALIQAKLIPNGEVDERSICDINPIDLKGFTQLHFFAGIGGWARAIELADWPSDRRVVTGSCPCQPWSVANVLNGGGKGRKDDRHLWPIFFRHIKEFGIDTIFGEQVVGAISKYWLDEVFTDLESENYACGAIVLPARAFGAAHRRDRLFWVANSSGKGRKGPEPIECLSRFEKETYPIDGDTLVRARRALDGDIGNLLHCNGFSVSMERDAIKGYGNAIVPQVAAEFIKAFM